MLDIRQLLFDAWYHARYLEITLREQLVMSDDENEISNAAALARLYRLEARRQALIALEIIDDAVSIDQLIVEAATDGGIDRQSLRRLKDTLEQEIAKLEANEATIAILGTMKSGKSTTINAVVGSEIVPSRDKPMTTFPTIVSHKAGLTEPELTFPLSEAFVKVAADIKSHLEQALASTPLSQLLAAAPGSEDLSTLAHTILAGHFHVPEKASGLAAIRAMLVRVNDLTRLADALHVSRAHIDEALNYKTVPRIDIEFEHIRSIDGALSGTLSLIDTPGPDEAIGSDRLTAISREQLEKASAIILIVNYRLMGGEAGEKITSLLALLPEGGADRLFVFVNQFDLREERDGKAGDDEVETDDEADRIQRVREDIGLQIFQRFDDFDRQSYTRIFPTSARQALRANQARRLHRLGEPLPAREGWATEFRGEVGSICAKAFLNTPNLRKGDGLREGADLLWAESRFSEPLEDVIATGARNASLILVQSCLDKLKGGEMARLFERLEISIGAFGARTEELKQLVDNLTADMALTARIEEENRRRIGRISSEVAPHLSEFYDNVMTEIDGILDNYITSAVYEEIPVLIDESLFNTIANGTRKLYSLFSSIVGREKAGGAEQPISPLARDTSAKSGSLSGYGVVTRSGRDDLILSSEEKAEKMANEIYSRIERQYLSGITSLVDFTRTYFNKIALEAKSVVDDSFSQGWTVVKDHIADVIKIEITPPDIEDSFSSKILFSARARAKGAKTTVETSVNTVRDSGAINAVKRGFAEIASWFGARPPWGTHTETTYHKKHVVEVGKIRAEMLQKSGELGAIMRRAVDDHVQELGESMSHYSTRVREKIEQIHRFINEERARKSGSAATYELLRQQVFALAGQARELKHEALALRRQIS